MQSRPAPRTRNMGRLLAAVLALETLEDRLPPGSLAFGGLPALPDTDLAAFDLASPVPAAAASLTPTSSDATPASTAGGVDAAAVSANPSIGTAVVPENNNTMTAGRDAGSNFAGPANQGLDEASLSAVTARRILLGLAGNQSATPAATGGSLSAAPDAGLPRAATGAVPVVGVDGQGVGLAEATLTANLLAGTSGGVTTQDADGFTVSPNTRVNSRTSCTSTTGKLQSETAIASYGNAVVVTYNDFRGFYCAASGYQVTGWGYSLDYGQTFTDGGPLPGGQTLRGDGELAVGPDGTFYMASLWNGLSGIAVLRGTATDTGINWSNPTVITRSGENFDKENIAIDPNSGAIYITYTRFGGTPGIGLLVSNDGGLTFQGPFSVVSVPGVQLQGSAPAVGPNGELYVAYNIGYPSDSGIGFVVSYDGGQTFTPPQQIEPTQTFAVAGADRSPSFPHIAVDLSGGPYTGNIYVSWHSAVAGQGEAVYAVSSDGGATWTDRAVINNDGGAGIEFFPTVSVDANGNLGAFFYSRRANPGSRLTDLYFAQSTDGGQSFGAAFPVTEVASNWNVSSDGGPTWGDYINAYPDYDINGNPSVQVAYADGRDGDPDAYYIRVSLPSG